MNYRPEIDGLRAVAVVPMILFHAGVSGFSGGYVGVDVFFVISGYLITSILLKDLETGRFSLARFYERRARRILPALSFVMLCCIPFAWLWMLPQELSSFGKSLVATSLFGSNVLFWRESGYFAAAAELKPLLHTWSLAVEEQYYVFFPVFLALLWRWGRSAILPALTLVIVISLIVAEWGANNAPSANFYLLPSRIWELLIGAAAAAYFGGGRQGNGTLGLLGLAMILFAVLFFDEETPTPSLWTLLPVAGTALILCFGHTGTLTARFLSVKPLVGIGLVSYSAYLWHQPLLAFARIRNVADPHGPLLWSLLAATFILAWATWRFVEQRFRGKTPILTNRRQVGLTSLAGMAAILLSGSTLVIGEGFANRKAPSGITFDAAGNLEAMLAPNYGLHPACDSERFAPSADCRTSDRPVMALWGDSFAMHLAGALKNSASSAPFAQLTLSQCGPIPDMALNGSVTSWKSCVSFNQEALEWILAQESLQIVVISSPFDQLARDLYTREGAAITRKAERKEAIVRRLAALDRQLAAAGKRLVVVSPPPRTGLDLGLCHVRSRLMGSPTETCDFGIGEHRGFSANSIELLQAVEAHVPVVWLERLICRDGTCRTTIGGAPLYRDAGHFSSAGAAGFGAAADLAAAIRTAAAGTPLPATAPHKTTAITGGHLGSLP